MLKYLHCECILKGYHHPTTGTSNTAAIVLGGVDQNPENITAVSVEDCMGSAEIFFRVLMASKYSNTRTRITDLITI